MVTEIATRDHLQPSLLDRLTDDEPSILRHTRRVKARVAQGEQSGESLDDRTGDHIDLWNRGITKTGDLFFRSRAVWFWELK